MKKIRYGIIGVGNQGTYYNNLFKNGEIENGMVTAYCDIEKGRLENAKASNINTAEFFTDYIEMLDSGLCDAVIVATPHYFHPKMVIDCLNRDIHVICDKPAGVYAKQVREMNDVAKSSKAKFTVMFNQRTNSLYKKMREIVQQGGIGNLQRVTWIITDWFRTQHYYDSGSWRATWKGEGGGVLINQCPHQLDLVQWVVGELPHKVSGFCHYGKWHRIEVEDDVTAYFEYKNGATGVFITTTGEAPGTNRFEISGTKGKIICENGKLQWFKNAQDSLELSKSSTQGYNKPDCEIINVETGGDNPQHKGIINNFTNHLLGLEKLFISGEEGVFGVELMNAIELSGWTGKAVTLPVDEDEYLEQLNKKIALSEEKPPVAQIKTEDTSSTFGS